MFEPTPQHIEQLERFTSETGAVIVTAGMPADDMRELAGLLDRWAEGERDTRPEIIDRFAIDPDDGNLY